MRNRYVVNIGFTLDWGHWPQLAVVSLAAVSGLAGRLLTGEAWNPLLGWFLVVWLAYTYTHLGFSLVLASLLATPGCEMPAIPHLLARLRGRDSAEHFCPGPLRWVDDWEAARRS